MHNRIRQLREHLGFSQAQFCQRLHCTTPYISMLESGKANPSDRMISDICGAYHVREAWLRIGEEPMFENGHDLPKFDIEQVGDRVRLIRKELHLSQAGLAKMVDCSKEQVYSVESQRLRPSHSWLKRVSSACGISLSWLISGEGSMFAPAVKQNITEENVIQYLQDNQDVQTRLVNLLKEDPQLLYVSHEESIAQQKHENV